MQIREFADADGVLWRVWSTIPRAGGAHPMIAGWLTFDSERARRRLVPVPPGWQDASVFRLRQYCLEAQPVGKTPARGTERIDEPDRP